MEPEALFNKYIRDHPFDALGFKLLGDYYQERDEQKEIITYLRLMAKLLEDKGNKYDLTNRIWNLIVDNSRFMIPGISMTYYIRLESFKLKLGKINGQQIYFYPAARHRIRDHSEYAYVKLTEIRDRNELSSMIKFGLIKRYIILSLGWVNYE